MRILLGSWSVFVLLLGVIMVKAEDTIEKKNASSVVDFNLLLEPIWDGTTIYEESLFFSEKTDRKEIEANLLFLPEKIISVTRESKVLAANIRNFL